MKLHVLSDLHTEFRDLRVPRTGADVVVLAGDIGVGLGGVEWAAAAFPDRPVVYVPGNHEFYHHDIGLAGTLKSAAPDNVHVLDNDSLELDGVRFLGSTLWTDYELHGEQDAWFARQRAREVMNDFALIRNGERPFTPEDSVALHKSGRAWLASELAREFDGPTVVVTHHLPAAPSIDRRYAGSPLNPAFASDLEALIDAHRPELWIHGHTHVPCDYALHGTRVVCNPRGYPGESSAREFQDGLLIEVG